MVETSKHFITSDVITVVTIDVITVIISDVITVLTSDVKYEAHDRFI